VLAFCALPAGAQSFPELNFTHINALDGLSSDIANCASEDHQGFIWIGTANGLNRYDGYRVKQYFHDINDSNSLAGNEVQRIYCDRKGRIWIMTSLGISCFYPETSRFINYSLTEPPQRRFAHLSDNPEVYEDPQGVIWISPNRDLLYRVREDMSLQKMPLGLSVEIRQDMLGQEWAHRDSLVFRLDPQTKRPVHTYNLAPKIKKQPITFLIPDSAGRYWLAAWQTGFWRFDPQTGRLDSVLAYHNIYNDPVLWKYDGTKWLVVPEANSGVYLIDPRSLRSKLYTPTLPQSISLQGSQFKSAFIDHTGALWLGSDKGINKVAPTHTAFDIHPIIDPDRKRTGQPVIGLPFGFGEVNGQFWVNLRGVGTYILSATDMRPLKYMASLNPLDNDHINATSSCYSFYQKQNDLYISTDDGLVDYKLAENKTHEYMPANLAHPVHFRNILPMNDHELWIRSYDNGVYVFDTETKQFIKHYPAVDSCHTCLPARINWLMRTRSGKVFLTGDGGILIEYDPAGDRFIRHQLTLKLLNGPDSIPAGKLFAIAEDDHGKLWVCSRSGVLIYDPARTITERVFMEAGQMGEIARICFDSLQNAWVNGYSGIWCFVRATGRWIHFTSRDGLPPGDAEGFLINDKRGYVIGGVQNALIRFYPSASLFAGKEWPVIITEAGVTGRVLNYPLNNKTHKQLLLQPGETSFTLDFAVLNYDNAAQNQYYYRLEPVMNDFETNANGHLNFNGLAPGSYLLRVKGGDKYGNIFPMGDQLAITVRPFYYQTTWFKLLMAALVLSILGLIAARIYRNIRQESDLRQKISQSEMMALRAQMNPHFIFNCLNSIDNLIQDDQKEKATIYLAKFARLIRAILEYSKKETIPCWKDLEALQLYLEMESLRLDEQFSWSFQVDDRIIRGDYKIPPMILQPFVENAIHHGLMNKMDADKQLKVAAQLVDNSIRFVVEDNGVGRSKAAEYKRINRPDHQSMGMEITLDRINYFNDDQSNTVKIIDLFNEDGSTAGTRIEIWINNQN
jgi:ligand-binding sensor domain-containing protein